MSWLAKIRRQKLQILVNYNTLPTSTISKTLVPFGYTVSNRQIPYYSPPRCRCIKRKSRVFFSTVHPDEIKVFEFVEIKAIKSLTLGLGPGPIGIIHMKWPI